MTSFETPTKRILSGAQLTAFQASETHDAIVSFIKVLNQSVVKVKISDDVLKSNGVRAILEVLQKVEEEITKVPPVENKASRFGNPAFRTFYDNLQTVAPSLHTTQLGLSGDATSELAAYFVQSWGNRDRIDYGSGMELNFLCWLFCLKHLGIVNEADYTALVIHVFWGYIKIMRILQSTYWLEPAGSHGVWGLDDYHFLPFLFGSAQLSEQRFPSPKAIHDPEIVDELAKDYMYFACIKFINSIKTASLRWHSPMLDDISAVKTWKKVNEGMLKMYAAEVLGKLPVIQHFLFGSILSYTGPPPPVNTNGNEHGHLHEGWGDCCGIPVPSAFAAAAQEREKGRESGKGIEGPGIRPVPFD